MGVDAMATVSKFGHVGTSDDDRARRTQARNRGGVCGGGRRMAQNDRARTSGVALNIK